MSSESQKLGEVLRKRREELHLSLKEVENGTSIRMSYLQSLEDGRLDALISPVYAQGFLRKYANFLQIDERRLLDDYPQVESQLTAPMKGHDFSSLGSIEVRGSPNKDQKWTPTLIWVGGSSLTMLCFWWIARHFGIV